MLKLSSSRTSGKEVKQTRGRSEVSLAAVVSYAVLLDQNMQLFARCYNWYCVHRHYSSFDLSVLGFNPQKIPLGRQERTASAPLSLSHLGDLSHSPALQKFCVCDEYKCTHRTLSGRGQEPPSRRSHSIQPFAIRRSMTKVRLISPGTGCSTPAVFLHSFRCYKSLTHRRLSD